MKTCFFVLTLCFTPFSLLISQPLLDPEMFPLEGIAGGTITPVDPLNLDEGPAGADMVWDFDSWSPDPEGLATTWGTSTLPYLSDPGAFPDATLGTYFYDTVYREEYYQKDITHLSLVGTWLPGRTLVYDDHELLLLSYMPFNDTFADAYHARAQGINFEYVLAGEKWTTYDAYGTLKVQGNSYPDVIRLRTEQTWRDTFYYDNGDTDLRAFNRTSYRWYYTFKCGPDVAFHYTTEHREHWQGGVLADSVTLPVKQHKTILDGCIHVVTKEPGALAGIQLNLVGANPAQDVINLMITSESAGRDLILQVFNQTGGLIETRSLTTTGGEQWLELQAANLSPGMYVVSLSDGKGRLSRRWMKL